MSVVAWSPGQLLLWPDTFAMSYRGQATSGTGGVAAQHWRGGFEVLPPCSSPSFHPSGCRDIWSHYTPHFKGSRGFQLQCSKGMQWLPSFSHSLFFDMICCITYAFLPCFISLSVIYYFCCVKCFIFFPFSFSVMVYFFDF